MGRLPRRVAAVAAGIAAVAGLLALAIPVRAAGVDVLFTLPNFTADNVPALVDDTQQAEIVYQDDFLATETTSLGSREASPEAEKKSASRSYASQKTVFSNKRLQRSMTRN